MNKGLTSFRAFAFFAVFLLHVDWLDAGYLGVQAFFVLSGFLLTPIIIQMKSSLKKSRFYINFYGRRALRIFPLYGFYLTIVYIGLTLYRKLSVYQAIAQVEDYFDQLPWALTYTYNFFHASDFYRRTYFLTHFWSLAVEEQFYLVWPILLYTMPTRFVRKFLGLVIFGAPLIRAITVLIFHFKLIPHLNTRFDMLVYVLPFSHMDAFACGGYFALYKKPIGLLRLGIMFMCTISLGCITHYLYAGYNVGYFSHLGFAPFMRDSYKYIWGYSILCILFSTILVEIRARQLFPAILECSLLSYLGQISYGLYVFHFPIWWLVKVNLTSYSHEMKVIASLLLTVLISALVYEIIEKRFLRLKDLYFPRTTTEKSKFS